MWTKAGLLGRHCTHKCYWNYRQCANKGFIVGKKWRASPRLHVYYNIHVVLSPQPLLPFPTLTFFEVYMLEGSMRDHMIRNMIVSLTYYNEYLNEVF